MKNSLLLYMIILVGGFTFANSFAQTETDMTTHGRLLVADAMLPDGGHLPYSYYLESNDNDKPVFYRLQIDESIQDIMTMSGKNVIVKGSLDQQVSALSLDQDSIPVINVDVIHPLADQEPLGSVQSRVAGTENIVTLLVKFKGVSDEFHTPDYFTARFYNDSDSLRQFFKTSSYGNFDYTGSVTSWKTLPSSNSTYDGGGGSINWTAMIRDSVQLHDPEVDFSSVDGIIIVTNGCPNDFCAAFGFLGKVIDIGSHTTDTSSRLVRLSLLPEREANFWCCGPDLDRGIGVGAHELGHNLNFEHTPLPPGDWLTSTCTPSCNDPYHDMWSVMSANWDQESPSALIMGLRDQIGWVSSANKVTVARGETKEITIDYINEPQDGANPQMVLIQIPDGTKYIVEAHKDEVFNDTPKDNQGIILYKFFPNGNNYSYLTFAGGIDKSAQYSLVGTAGTTIISDFTDANLAVSETWTDSVNNVTVRTDSMSSESITVSISNAGSALPPLCAPPPGTDWDVLSSCSLESDVVADKNVIIRNGAVLTISTGFTLDIDFSQFNITIQDGGALIIQAGGLLR